MLDGRVRALEERAIADDGLHASLARQDSLTAVAVADLTKAINDPKAGLIVELDKFRAEVRTDRESFRSWVRGATFVLSAVFGIVTIAAPWVRDAIQTAIGR